MSGFLLLVDNFDDCFVDVCKHKRQALLYSFLLNVGSILNNANEGGYDHF